MKVQVEIVMPNSPGELGVAVQNEIRCSFEADRFFLLVERTKDDVQPDGVHCLHEKKSLHLALCEGGSESAEIGESAIYLGISVPPRGAALNFPTSCFSRLSSTWPLLIHESLDRRTPSILCFPRLTRPVAFCDALITLSLNPSFPS